MRGLRGVWVGKESSKQKQTVDSGLVEEGGEVNVIELTLQGISTQGFFSCSEAQKFIYPYMNVNEDNNIGKNSKERGTRN